MTQAPSVSDTTIRAAQQRDAAALADLSGQLGYPATTEEIEGRLATIEPLDASIVLVACDRTDRPLGWGQVELRRTLVEPLAGQVMAGKLSAPVDTVYPIEKIKEALAHADKGGRNGKILVSPNGLI